MSGPFKFTLLGLSGEHTIYKKQVNIILSNILEGCGWGKSYDCFVVECLYIYLVKI